jgi:alkylation response protein AidB-like acyl-CoA dehydrogenase
MESGRVLEIGETYLREEVAPKAQEIDRDPEALREALNGLCQRELMALKRPAEYGGPGLPDEEFRRFQETCSRYSGALAFLQTQHQSAVSMLSRSANQELKQEYLPKMGNGERLVGIGFSQLRRGGPPIMRAEETDGGYMLNGQVPWITGWSFYPEFLVGATLPDGQAVFAVVPLTEHFGSDRSESGHGTIEISEPMRLAAMETALTVSASFHDWFVPADKVAFIQPADWIKNNDQINIALQGHFALGCAEGGLDSLKAAAEKKDICSLHDAHEKLSEELARCRQATREAQKDASEETTDERLKVRAWAIDLAVRCAHAAVTAWSGAANSVNHPAQRLYREALVYTVSAQTVPIMEATLDRIVSRGATA